MPEDTTRALSELARSSHSTVNVVLQGAWAVLLASLTGQHDVAFGTVVSGRPAELAGAESMVGLLINTVPVRARITAATTTAELLDQLQRNHNDTLEHEHLALSEIHRVTGQERLFDTVFVYENYPTDTAALSGDHELAITELNGRDYYHYPLAVQAGPGNELDLRVQYRSDVFDVADIEALIERFTRVLEAMTSDPARPLSSIDGWGNPTVLTQGAASGGVSDRKQRQRQRSSCPGCRGRATADQHLRPGAGRRPRRDRRVVFRPGRRFAVGAAVDCGDQ